MAGAPEKSLQSLQRRPVPHRLGEKLLKKIIFETLSGIRISVRLDHRARLVHAIF
jgi:hypothetical protein